MGSDTNQQNKAAVWDFWQKMNHVEPENMTRVIREAMHEDVDWNGSQPINQLNGVDAVSEGFWQPLRFSFPDIQRKVDIFLGGICDGDQWVSGLGYLTGTFAQDWLGIPPKTDRLRGSRPLLFPADYDATFLGWIEQALDEFFADLKLVFVGPGTQRGVLDRQLSPESIRIKQSAAGLFGPFTKDCQGNQSNVLAVERGEFV